MTDLYKANLAKANITCSECGRPTFDHQYPQWIGHSYVYEKPCDKTVTDVSYKRHALGISGPYNVFRMENKQWIFAYNPCIKYMYLLPFVEGMAIRSADAMLNPKPKIIRTVGDVYNLFLVRKEIDDLKKITKHSTFYRMRRTALARVVRKT